MPKSKLAELAARRDTVRVTFKPEVKVQDLHAIIDRVITQAGCPACGLNGIDIHLGRPVEIDLIRDIPAVQGIEII